MFLAVEENDTKALRIYLTQRNVHPDTLFETNIFEENTFTWSALHAAAYYGAKEVVDLLMEFNANVELEDTWYKGRPLAWAAFGGMSLLSFMQDANPNAFLLFFFFFFAC
jgi:ankyrin repeat protein